MVQLQNCLQEQAQAQAVPPPTESLSPASKKGSRVRILDPSALLVSDLETSADEVWATAGRPQPFLCTHAEPL